MSKYKIEVLVNATNRRGRAKELSKTVSGKTTSLATDKVKSHLKSLQDAGYKIVTVTTFGYWRH